MVTYFMISKSVVQLQGLLVYFGKNAGAASRESLLLDKNEKNELGFQHCTKNEVFH